MKYPRHFSSRLHWLSILLLPVSVLFRFLIRIRKALYVSGIIKNHTVRCPVIVVGNITVGGTGKTPLVLALVELLKANGFKPAIISRGYGGRSMQWPLSVTAQSDPLEVGDEPLMMARRQLCPLVVGPDRVADAEYLLENHQCDIIICDDGLQHYRLARDIEILVIDGERGFGNQRCLPAGPLREPVSRVQSVDYIVVNGHKKRWFSHDNEYIMNLECDGAFILPSTVKGTNLTDARLTPLTVWQGQTVHAVAGIGNPDRFFKFLQTKGIKVIKHGFADHHPFKKQELEFNDNLPILFTEKDAVKCSGFNLTNSWVVPVAAKLNAQFNQSLLNKLAMIRGENNGF